MRNCLLARPVSVAYPPMTRRRGGGGISVRVCEGIFTLILLPHGEGKRRAAVSSSLSPRLGTVSPCVTRVVVARVAVVVLESRCHGFSLSLLEDRSFSWRVLFAKAISER